MRLATALIRVLRRLAPRAVRDRWAEEWLGEIEHANAGLRFAAGAIPDVVTLYRLPPVGADRHSWLNGVGRDFRHAARNLWAAPGFSATVVVSLTLGIVVVAGTYAFINAARFPTLPGVRDQGRLIEIYTERSTLDDRAALREAVPGVHDVASSMERRFAIAARGEGLSVPGVFVSANYFEVLGTRIQAGRGFLDTEDRPADGAAVVLGFALSRRLFRDDNPVGAFMTVGGHPVHVVGVAEGGFRGTYTNFDADVDIFVAWGMASRFAADPANDFQRPDAAPGEYELTHIARLSESALAEVVLDRGRVVAMGLVTARIGPKYRPVVRVRPLGRDDDETAPQIAAIFAIPFLVLLIGCINAAMVLLARGTQRMRDIAVRLALGAGRWRIVRYLLAESLLLALMAAALTLPVLSWMVAVLERFVPLPFEVDGRVVTFAVVVSCVSVLGFGLAPALRLARIGGGLALGSSRAGETPRRSQIRQALVAVQVALSIGLMTTGAQLITGVQQLAGVTGVDSPSRLLMVSFDLSQLSVTPGRAEAFYSGLLERVVRVPGVERVGLGGTGGVWTDGRGKTSDNSTVVWPPNEKPERGQVWIGGYAGGDLIEAVGLRLVAGRLFTPADRTGTPRVAIVNQTAATRHFNGAAVGRIIRAAPRGGSYATGHDVEIVGVISPALDPGYVPNPDDPTVEAIYLPERLRHEPALTLYVRRSEGAAPVLGAIQQAASDVDPAVPIVGSATLAEHQLEQQAEARFAAQGVSVLGIVGLVLAAGGLYGMVAFLVASRRREIGVRVALGARPQAILGLILRQGTKTALVGAVAGGAIAVVVSIVVRGQMYGVPPVDMLALAAVALLLGSVVLVASLIPARAAARVDPLVVLREE